MEIGTAETKTETKTDSLENEFELLRGEVAGALAEALDAGRMEEIESLRVRMLGRKGKLTEMLKSLGGLPPERRREMGAAANKIRDAVHAAIEDARRKLARDIMDRALLEEKVDVTLPGRRRPVGARHPISATFERLESLFLNLGFEVADGRHIETGYHNFDALNTPASHPSRDPQDTFYFGNGFLLRTHTSPTQVRAMESRKPPIRIVAPGMVFRRDEIDATHTPVFHQMEGLVIDEGVTFGDLKGCLETIARYLFGDGAKIRLRPSYFPFTEPSAEVDITCYACANGIGPWSDCRVCKGGGWIELWGCGMVHTKVLRASGINPEKYTGYAFGLGVDRITSALHGIADPRLYFENDAQFLGQFRGRF